MIPYTTHAFIGNSPEIRNIYQLLCDITSNLEVGQRVDTEYNHSYFETASNMHKYSETPPMWKFPCSNSVENVPHTPYHMKLGV